MFSINNIQWYIKFVHPNSRYLYRRNGTLTVGMCDSDTKTIYINEKLQGKKLKKVLSHELTHAAMFSYQMYLSYKQEEVIADIIATYGKEIVSMTDTLFEKIRMERL